MGGVMNAPVSPAVARRTFTGCLAGLFLVLVAPQMRAAGPPAGAMKEYQSAPDEFSALGKNVMELLRSGDAAGFATNLAATAEDWKSVYSTNLPAQDEDALKGLQRMSGFDRQKVEASAKVVLEKASALHLDFAKGEWHPRVVVPKHF